MRLLHTTSMKLESFVHGSSQSVPPYAILSHTWDREEILFEDVANITSEVITKKAGFSKVQQSCAQARSDGYDYIWIDTLCIDKSSSVELSEAINSMFEWYAGSAVCYAYIADVVAAGHDDDYDDAFASSSFRTARWFSRGWTLQELIAPETVIFFDRDWVRMGDRVGLANDIMARTGIDRLILSRQVVRRSNSDMVRGRLQTLSAAHKMSWVAQRATTVPEDMAYCLLGLFDVNLPLLYGEGQQRAFTRLQEEIARTHTSDQSILLWHGRPGADYGNDSHAFQPVFAPSPARFQAAERVSTVPGAWVFPTLMLTNEGLRANVHFCPTTYASTSSSPPETEGNLEEDGVVAVVVAVVVPRPPPLYLALMQCASVEDPVRRPGLLLYNVGDVLHGGKHDKPEDNQLRGVFARATSEVVFIDGRTRSLEVVLPNTERPVKIDVDLTQITTTWLLLIRSGLMTKDFSTVNTAIPLRFSFHADADATWYRHAVGAIYRDFRPEVPVWKSSPSDMVLSTSLDLSLHVVIGCHIVYNTETTTTTTCKAFLVIWGFQPLWDEVGKKEAAGVNEQKGNSRWWQSREYFCRVLPWIDDVAGGTCSPETIARLTEGEGLIWNKPFWSRFVGFVKSVGDAAGLDSFKPRHQESIQDLGLVTAEIFRRRFLDVDYLQVGIEIETAK